MSHYSVAVFEDLNGKTVGMLTGAPFEELIRSRAPEVREIRINAQVAILEKGEIWCLITFEGDEGYCLTSQLKLIPPAT